MILSRLFLQHNVWNWSGIMSRSIAVYMPELCWVDKMQLLDQIQRGCWNTNLSLLYSSVYKCSLIHKSRAIWCNLLGVTLDAFIGISCVTDVNSILNLFSLLTNCNYRNWHFSLLKVAHNMFWKVQKKANCKPELYIWVYQRDNKNIYQCRSFYHRQLHQFSCDGISECYHVRGSFCW